MGSQIVCNSISLTENVSARTSGGQTVLVDTSRERVTINGANIKQVLKIEMATLVVMDKLLFLRDMGIESVKTELQTDFFEN